MKQGFFVFFQLILLVFFPFSLTIQCKSPKQNLIKPYDRDDMPVKIKNLKGNVYLIEDFNFWKTNSLFWVGESGAYFINSTYQKKSAARVEWKASSLTLEKFHALILTGSPFHFTGGASYFSDRKIKILSHPETGAILNQNLQSLNQKFKSEFSQWKEAEPIQAESLNFNYDYNSMNKDSNEYQKKLSILPQIKTAFLNDGKIILIDPNLPDLPGQIIVYFPIEKILYGSDTITSIDITNSLNKNSLQFKNLIKLIQALQPEIIVSGHGDPFLDLELFNQE